MPALALTDHSTLAGAVRFYQAARKAGIKPILGVEFEVEPIGGHPLHFPRTELASSEPRGRSLQPEAARLLLLAADNQGYSNLCRLVTCAHLGEARSAGPFSEAYSQVDRRHPLLRQEHLRRYASHLIGLSSGPRGEVERALRRGQREQAIAAARYYAELLGPENFYLELQHHRLAPEQRASRYRLRALAEELGLPVVATNDVHYLTPEYAPLQDALYCLGQGLSLEDRRPERKPNAEYYLKSEAQMRQLFADLPEALAATGEIAERCYWELNLGAIHLPRFDCASAPGFRGDPDSAADRAGFLRSLCEAALPRRYPPPQQAPARQQMEHELEILNHHGLADYFLIVWDLVRFAETQGLRHSGRGSAAGSLICYLLDITQPEPLSNDLLFERFLNPERRDLPDIDLDFDTRRREEVVAYVYRKYGPEHVAAVATVNTFRARGAVRELGKVLGISPRQIDRLAQNFAYVDLARLPEMLEKLPEVRSLRPELRHHEQLLQLCQQVAGFPRHLATHCGGLVISAQPLTDLVPLQLADKGIVIAQYDKDDLEALGLIKMDLLGLRIHTAVEHSLQLLRKQGQPLDLTRIPLDDPACYEVLRSTNTLGLFQLESPGQRNLQGRLLAERFEDIISGISLFRPGPVQADMITPFLARRRGQQPVHYLHPDLQPILERTYGVIIYQEQVMRVAAALGGFTLGEADRLRKAMNFEASPQDMENLRAVFLAGAARRGLPLPVAEEIFSQLAAFAAFGFNKAHAASFARLSYETAYLKAHHPAEFFAGLLSAQPMGFYPARTLAEEAKRLGIALLPPDVNRSQADYTVETGQIRCGLRFVREMTEPALQRLLNARRDGPFESLRDFCARTAVPYPVVENLILAQAFAFTGQPLPQLLGALASLARQKGPRTLDPSWDSGVEAARQVAAETLTPLQRLRLDLHLLGLSTGLHPFTPWLETVQQRGVTPTNRLLEYPHGARVRVAGIVVARARPPVRSGRTTLFLCLEDQAGLVDITVFQEAYQRYGSFLYSSPVLMAEGELTRRGERDVALTVQRLWPLPLPQSVRTQGASPYLPPLEASEEAYARTGPGSYGG